MNSDNKFTNSGSIQYPLETDVVDVKVLNNNTRLLDEKKLEVKDLTSVAKEETSQQILTNINNIDGQVSNNLVGVAKETTPKNIENQIAELKDAYDGGIGWFGAENTKIVQTSWKIGNMAVNSLKSRELVSIGGSGKFIGACVNFSGIGVDDEIKGTVGKHTSIRLEIKDGTKVLFDLSFKRVFMERQLSTAYYYPNSKSTFISIAPPRWNIRGCNLISYEDPTTRIELGFIKGAQQRRGAFMTFGDVVTHDNVIKVDYTWITTYAHNAACRSIFRPISKPIEFKNTLTAKVYINAEGTIGENPTYTADIALAYSK